MSQQPKLGEMLVRHGIIDSFQLSSALNHQAEWQLSLGESLVELGFISENALLKALSEYFQVPSVNLTLLNVSPNLLQKMPLAVASMFQAIPIGERLVLSRKKLLVAMIDPLNEEHKSAIEFHVGCPIISFVCTLSGMRQSLREFYRLTRSPETQPTHQFHAEQLITELMRQKELLNDHEKKVVIGHSQPVAILGRLLFDKKLINRDELFDLLEHLPLQRKH